MSRHKVSRGNTSDLIGMFNKKSQIEAPSSGDVGGLLSVNPGSLGVSHKFRKTSAFVPSTTKIEDKVKGQGLFLIRHVNSNPTVYFPTCALEKYLCGCRMQISIIEDLALAFKSIQNK